MVHSPRWRENTNARPISPYRCWPIRSKAREIQTKARPNTSPTGNAKGDVVKVRIDTTSIHGPTTGFQLQCHTAVNVGTRWLGAGIGRPCRRWEVRCSGTNEITTGLFAAAVQVNQLGEHDASSTSERPEQVERDIDRVTWRNGTSVQSNLAQQNVLRTSGRTSSCLQPSHSSTCPTTGRCNQ